jgi:Fur family peroxide stress response transcriptional regulator
MSNNAPSKAAQRLEHIEAVTRRAGVKLTHQRLEIFKELALSDEHPSADMIFRAVQRRVSTVSVDTVYRTLWMLHDLGLLTTLGPQREGVRFDGNLEPHHHYLCVRCGLVRDFESAELDALRVARAVKQLGTVTDAHVEVRGVCASCQASRADEPSTTASTSLPPKKSSTR